MDYRTDFSHEETKARKYPDGMCGRPNCWPCVTKRLDRGDGATSEGLARMAAARRAASTMKVGSSGEFPKVGERMRQSLELDKLDVLVLARVPDPMVLSKEHECYKIPDEPWRRPVDS